MMTIGEVIEMLKSIFALLMEYFQKFFGNADDGETTTEG